MKLGPSLHRIGNRYVSSYLVEEGGLVTIIDAALPGLWGPLQAELAAMGRSLDDVRALVLTHGDSDHIGFAERLRRERGVPVYVHRLDAARARGEDAKKAVSMKPRRLGATVAFLGAFARMGGLRVPPVHEVMPFDDDATLDVPGAPRVIALPGHTPGSVGYHVERVSALCVGDALTTRSVLTGEEGPQPAPFSLDPAGAIASLARIEDVPAAWLLPGHGDPWTHGVAEAIARIRAAAPSAAR